MTEEQAKEFLLALNPIVSAVVEASLHEHARENMGTKLAPGVGVEYLRLGAAVEAVGWETALTLPEIKNLLDTCVEVVVL